MTTSGPRAYEKIYLIKVSTRSGQDPLLLIRGGLMSSVGF